MDLVTGLKLDDDAESEPLTLAEVKVHLRVDISDDDAWLNNAITAARRAFEQFAECALIQQTWVLALSRFPVASDPDGDQIVLPRPPFISITLISYTDENGVGQSLSAADYFVDDFRTPARIIPAYGKSWPAVQEFPAAVQVKYRAGFGAAAGAVDPRARQAILLLISHWYENRGTVLVGTISKELEFSLRALAHQLWHGRLS